MRCHREVEVLRPTLGDLLAGSQELVVETRAQHRSAASLADLVDEGGELLEVGLAAESWGVPDATTAEAHEQHGRPPVVPVPDRAARRGHGSVDLPVPLELPEEDRHEPG